MKLVTTFPSESELTRARAGLEALSLPFEVISPRPGYGAVGAPGLVVESTTRTALARAGVEFACSGWVEHRSAGLAVPDQEPPRYSEDVFGRAAVMVLARCTADEGKVRIVAHASGDLTDVFPYLNAEMKQACYNVHGPTFTFMDGYRMVSAYARRVAVAKADDIVDAWRVLEALRRLANETWARRDSIEPSYERRQKPPALEIYKRLPRTNCGACGEQTCLAFAVRLHGGWAAVSACTPVFGGEHAHLKEALVEVCSGLGVGL